MEVCAEWHGIFFLNKLPICVMKYYNSVNIFLREGLFTLIIIRNLRFYSFANYSVLKYYWEKRNKLAGESFTSWKNVIRAFRTITRLYGRCLFQVQIYLFGQIGWLLLDCFICLKIILSETSLLKKPRFAWVRLDTLYAAPYHESCSASSFSSIIRFAF